MTRQKEKKYKTSELRFCVCVLAIYPKTQQKALTYWITLVSWYLQFPVRKKSPTLMDSTLQPCLMVTWDIVSSLPCSLVCFNRSFQGLQMTIMYVTLRLSVSIVNSAFSVLI